MNDTQIIDTRAERDREGLLYYGEKPFAVWCDGADGEAHPYLVDQHTWARVTDALSFAADWAWQQPGSRAIVYHRESGQVMAHYYQNQEGQRCCLLFTPQGESKAAANAHLLKGTWKQQRQTIVATFLPKWSDLGLFWENYRWARRNLAQLLRTRGVQVDADECLADLLRRCHLSLLDMHTNRRDSDSPAGEIIFDPSVPYYDARHIKEVMVALAPCLWKTGSVQAVCGGKQVVWRFRVWGSSWDIEVTYREKQHLSTVAYRIEYPDGGSIDVSTLADVEDAAKDVLLWRVLFAREQGESVEALLEDEELIDQFIATAIDLVVPRRDAYDALRALVDIEPNFFREGSMVQTIDGVSAADIVYLKVRGFVERVYREHWSTLVASVRKLIAS